MSTHQVHRTPTGRRGPAPGLRGGHILRARWPRLLGFRLRPTGRILSDEGSNRVIWIASCDHKKRLSYFATTSSEMINIFFGRSISEVSPHIFRYYCEVLQYLTSISQVLQYYSTPEAEKSTLNSSWQAVSSSFQNGKSTGNKILKDALCKKCNILSQQMRKKASLLMTKYEKKKIESMISYPIW